MENKQTVGTCVWTIHSGSEWCPFWVGALECMGPLQAFWVGTISVESRKIPLDFLGSTQGDLSGRVHFSWVQVALERPKGEGSSGLHG